MKSGSSAGRMGDTIGSGRGRRHADAERLAALTAMIDDLSEQIDVLEGAARRPAPRIRAPQPARPEPAPRREAPSLDARFEALGRQLDGESAARLDRIEARLSQIGERLTAREAPPPRAERQVDDIRTAIAEIAARQHMIDVSGDRASASERAVERGIAEIREEIAALGRRIASAAASDRQGDVISRIDALRSEQASEAEMLHALRVELAELRHAVDATARETTLATIESGYGHIIERLDDLGRRMPETGRIEGELDDLRHALAAMAAARPEAEPIEPQLGAIKEAIDGLYALPRGVEPDAIVRLEDRLDALAGRFDALATHVAPDAIHDIEGRLRAIAEQFESAVGPISEIGTLRADLADLKRDMTQEPARFSSIEAQMSELAARLDAVTSDEDDEAAFAELEAKVGALAAQFSAGAAPPDALAKVEENLDRLESMLGDTRRETIAAAREAARASFDEFAGSLPSRTDDPMVRALKEDMNALRAAARDGDARTQHTLEAVHDTLAKVVERLSRLETEPERALATTRPPRASAEDHRPLEPGSGKPDLSALREPAPEPRARPADRKADFIAAARRAAQAAQAETAAAALSEPVDEDDDEPARGSTFARIGHALRSRRRPLVLAMAAVVLAIGAVQFLDRPTISKWVGSVTASKTADPALDRNPTASVPVKPVSSRAPQPGAPAAMMVAPKTDTSALAFAPPVAAATGFGTDAAAPPADGFAGQKPADLPPATLASLQTAAAKGDAAAAFEMGARFAEGRGVPQDAKLSAEWYERAAKAGQPLAQYRVGSLYERGEGVTRDVATAAHWYELASAQGNARATHNLAVIASEGASGQPDYERAVALFLKAATWGVKDSQYNLGVLYARGLGVKQDLVQSYKWFALAALQGDTDAGLRRDEVAQAMKPETLAKARAAVQNFTALPLDAAANSEPAPKAEWASAATRVSAIDGPILLFEAQRLLASRGFDPGAIDGRDGPQTRAAIRAFQRASGLAETGVADRHLLVTLGGQVI